MNTAMVRIVGDAVLPVVILPGVILAWMGIFPRKKKPLYRERSVETKPIIFYVLDSSCSTSRN